MENKSFDDIINSKLSQFSVDSDSAAWELYEQSLDASEFDARITDQLDDYSVELPASSWADFERYRESAEFDASIGEKVRAYDSEVIPDDFVPLINKMPSGFDALIGAKLAEASVNDGADWDSFEKILTLEENFDADVKQKVEEFEAPLSGSQWPKLSEHLEKIERRRRRIVITKFVEAAVFLLFILSIMQLYPIDKIAKKPVYRTHGVAQDLENVGKKDKLTVNSKNNQGEIAESLASKEDAKEQNVILAETQEIVFSEVSSSVTDATNQTIEIVNSDNARPLLSLSSLEVLPISSQVVRSDFDRVTTNEEVAKVSNIGTEKISQIAYSRPTLRLNADKDETASGPNVVLASLDFQDLEAKERDFSISSADLSSKQKRGQYWFNLYGSPQINMINTPFDKSYSDNRAIVGDEIPAYSHLADGYSLGASISSENAYYEIEGGLEYTSLNYLPKQVTERVSNATAGYKEFLLKEIIFDIIEIPLTIKYNFFKKKGWKLYGTNGASVGIVAFANYDIEEKEFKPLATALAGQSPRRKELSFVDRKDLDNTGFVKTKNFLKNSYTTLNVGMGVSKEISDQISFYIQPNYYHNLSQSGIGPNEDVHHRLAVQIGTKVRL